MPTDTPPTIPAQPAPAPHRYEATVWAAYATVLEQETLARNADIIGEVNFVWYQVGPGGQLSGSVQSTQALEAARAAGLRVVPSVQNTGFSREAVLAAIGADEARAAHIAELVALAVDNGYDGLDIDYESLAAEDRDLFSAFIEELAAALHAEGKLLSIAVHPKTDEQGTWGGPAAQDYARLGAAVDEFKIMTYDYHWSTSEAGPIAPIAWADEVLAYAATVVPPEKTYLGLHFYGYSWLSSRGESLEWQQAVKLPEMYGAEVERDENAEAWFAVGDEGRPTVYYADAQTTAAKLEAILARHPQIAGVAIWRVGGEDPENWEAIRAEFGRPAMR